MEQKNIKRAVTYCRVSTKEQVDEGNSLNSQRKLCNDYCASNQYDIVEKFVEEGESAKTADRTELKRLLTFCADKKNRINAVVVYKIDRLSRNTDDYSALRTHLRKSGVEIKSATEHFDDNPSGRFMENMMANVAQFDNDVRAERCSGGMKDAMREGRYVWMAPIGYMNIRVADKATIAPSPMASLVVETFETIAKGIYAIEEVRKMMSKRGLVTRTNKPVVKSYFYRMLKNRVYVGYIEKFGESHKGGFEPLITQELFDQVQKVLKNRGKKMSQYKLDSEDFPLRRFVTNPQGKKVTGSWCKGRYKSYPYYRFSVKGENYKRDEFEKAFMAYMDQHKLNSEMFAKLKGKLKVKLGKALDNRNKGSGKLESRIRDLTQTQNTLIQKNLKGFVSDTVLKKQLDIIEKEISTTQEALASQKEVHVDFDELLDYAREYLLNPSKVWKSAKLDKQLKLQWFQFPQGVTFDGTNYGTTQIASVYKTKEAFLPLLSTSVDLRRLELLTFALQKRCSTN